MLNALRRSVLLRLAVMTLFLAFVGVSWGQASKRPVSSEPQRKQLAMGYTLLYQEADGIPKLKWILTFRKKSDEMARVTDDEQRHLAGVILGLETEPALKEFLQKTKGQLDAKYGRVGALLDRKYFAH